MALAKRYSSAKANRRKNISNQFQISQLKQTAIDRKTTNEK